MAPSEDETSSWTSSAPERRLAPFRVPMTRLPTPFAAAVAVVCEATRLWKMRRHVTWRWNPPISDAVARVRDRRRKRRRGISHERLLVGTMES